MRNSKIVTAFFPVSRPEADFDATPNVSAVIGEDGSGMPMLGAFASSVELTRAETANALSALFGLYSASYSKSRILTHLTDDEELARDRAIHRSS